MEHDMATHLTEDSHDGVHASAHDLNQDEPLLNRLTNQAPWWLVSMVFHVLLIVMAYMFSIAVTLDSDNDAPLLTVTKITRPADLEKDQALKKEVRTSALSSTVDIPPTDPNSPDTSNIVVPPDILAMAELGDHIETINLDRPDTHNALGNPDAHIFHSVKGVDEPPGGGGNHGNIMEDIIGSGGARGPGSGGGFGGGDGTGVGADKGSFRGSIGLRNGGGRKVMIKRFHGEGTQNAVDAALHWLAYHQETDGHWDAKKYEAGEKTDTAVTAMALLAFLGYGHSERVGEHREVVKRAVAWLRSKQAANGLVWDTTDAGGHRGEGYPGAIATLALAEAAAMASVPETRDAAQRAVTYCTEIHQAGEGSDKLGWRYHAKMEGDLSVTGWYIMALKSAAIAKLNLNHGSMDGAIKFLDSVEHRAPGGDPAYSPSTYWYTVKDAHEPHRLTAIGCLCRQFLGWKKEELQASIDGFVTKGGVPSWGGNGGGVDLYYWYYGSLCTFQQGGATWDKWNEGLKSALLPNQRKEGDAQGSWDPVGAYAGEWGRVGETALGALCLEVYYRYAQLNPGK